MSKATSVSNRVLSYGSKHKAPNKTNPKLMSGVDKRVAERLAYLEDRCFRLESQLEMMYDDYETWRQHVSDVKTKYPKGE